MVQSSMYRGVEIDYEKDNELSEMSRAILMDRYNLPDEESPQQIFARAASAYAEDKEHAQRMYSYITNRWFIPASPILSNGGTDRGLPISCFGSYVPDSRGGITDHYAENAWLSSIGGGTAGYWGHVRSSEQATSRGSKSTGAIPFIKVTDSLTLAFAQGTNRRGAYAAYMDVSHPEIEEFIDIRRPTGDENRRAKNIHNGICIPDSFMRKITGEDDNFMWELVDPNSKEVTSTVDARALWVKILQSRLETGEPYIVFSDTVHRALPDCQKSKGLRVYGSNLCSEILLPTTPDRSFVCCLGSVNLETFDDWDDHKEQMIPDIVLFLDNVLQYFIDNAPDAVSKAVASAEKERAIGIGFMGLHALCQKNMVPFAQDSGADIVQEVKELAVLASRRLAKERGEPEDMEGTGLRHSHLLAVAPNANIAPILDTSPGIEPYAANVFVQKTMSGNFSQRNRYLASVLDQYDMNIDSTWSSIATNKGSVQHLTFLTDYEREVFKTAYEIDQMDVVINAAYRQPFICQAQSLNLFFAPDSMGKLDAKKVHDVHITAWASGVKTLYYLRSLASSRVENVSERIERSEMSITNKNAEIGLTPNKEIQCYGCD